MSADSDRVPRKTNLEDYIDWVRENPDSSSLEDAPGYLADALLSYGTRTVIEEGREVERPKWTDREPYVIFGNSETLYELTNTFSQISDNDLELIPRIEGKSGTGKSQIANAMIKAVYDYARTDEGALYALSLADPIDGNLDEGALYDSPINSDPLTLLKTLEHFDFEMGISSEELENDINESRDSPVDLELPERLGPQLREIVENYVFEQEIDWNEIVSDYAFAKRMYVDVGVGVSRATSEADLVNSAEEELFGHQEEDNPGEVRQWPMNGYLQAGNRIMTIIDDADQGEDALQLLQSVADGEDITFKGTKKPYSLDTVPIIIKNPDEGFTDPIPNSVKRRFEEFEVNYLTNASIESELIRYMLGEEWTTLEEEGLDPDESLEMARRALESEKEVRNGENGREIIEYSPHTVEALALADVISRLEDERNEPVTEAESEEAEEIVYPEWKQDREFPENSERGEYLTLLEKGLIFTRGYANREREYKGETYSEILERQHFEFREDTEDGQADSSIPVTVAVDALSKLEQNPPEIQSEGNPVIMPWHALDELRESVREESTLSTGRTGGQRDALDRIDTVEEFIYSRMERDILDAVFWEQLPDDELVEEYIDMLDAYSNGDGGPMDSREVEEQDLRKMEEENFAFSGENKDPIDEFRGEVLLKSGPKAYKSGEEESKSRGGVNLNSVRSRLGTHDWDDINRIMGHEYSEFDEDLTDLEPMNITLDREEVEELGNDTMRLMSEAAIRMVEEMGYSPLSARLTLKEIQQRKLDQLEG
jgi:hypothetical protein